MVTTKHYITATGLEEVEKEYDYLINVKRPQVIARIAQTREMGDLAENSAYDEAREEQALLESRIETLEKMLKRSVVIAHDATATEFIVIGSKVKCEMNGEIHEFTIVGSIEANPMEGKISNESPVGKALLGTKQGEHINIQVGPVKTLIKVLEIQ